MVVAFVAEHAHAAFEGGGFTFQFAAVLVDVADVELGAFNSSSDSDDFAVKRSDAFREARHLDSGLYQVLLR